MNCSCALCVALLISDVSRNDDHARNSKPTYWMKRSKEKSHKSLIFVCVVFAVFCRLSFAMCINEEDEWRSEKI